MENQDKSKFNDHLRERTIQMAAILYLQPVHAPMQRFMPSYVLS
jgi:hypothetical protein